MAVLVGGAICLVNSDNERDFGLLISFLSSVLVQVSISVASSRGGGVVGRRVRRGAYFLEGQARSKSHEIEQ